MKYFLLFFLSWCCFFCGNAFEISRVEPLCWWEGMQTDLQLMIYGENLNGADVSVNGHGLKVKKVHTADSPNYLFVDLDVSKAGKYTIVLDKKGERKELSYEILKRRPAAEAKQGLTPQDVIYLIVPDRFANGDETNDIIPGSIQELNRSKLDVRHGGDIQGIIDHLDYLSDLGVTTIWPTPMLEDNQYYHHYAISDYYRIDPHLGTNELYRELVNQAHLRGLKVIQDVVPNHCGSGHWWMQDLPFRDWVNKQVFDYSPGSLALPPVSDIHASKDDIQTTGKGWLYESMPDMNLDNPFVLQYLTQMAVWWIEYANLDALRVDTYFYMGIPGSKWTQNIRKEYPEMRFVGEVWNDNPSFVSYWVGDYKKHNGFASNLPMAMDFPLQRAIVTGLASDNPFWGGSTNAIYNVVAQDFLYKDANTELVVFADNHDIDRIYNMLGKNIEKTKTAITVALTMRGTPQLYYGTELLFENDPRGGGHHGRPDFPGGWKSDTLNLFDSTNRNEAQADMFKHVQTLLRFRKTHPVLANGDLMHYVPADNVYTYFRYDDKSCVMVVINGSDKKAMVDWTRFEERLKTKNKGIEIFSGQSIEKGQAMEVEGFSSAVIYFE